VYWTNSVFFRTGLSGQLQSPQEKNSRFPSGVWGSFDWVAPYFHNGRWSPPCPIWFPSPAPHSLPTRGALPALPGTSAHQQKNNPPDTKPFFQTPFAGGVLSLGVGCPLPGLLPKSFPFFFFSCRFPVVGGYLFFFVFGGVP